MWEQRYQGAVGPIAAYRPAGLLPLEALLAGLGYGAFAVGVLSRTGVDPLLTAQDDLIVGDAAGNAARLAVGTAGQVLAVDPGGHVDWRSLPVLDVMATYAATGDGVTDDTTAFQAALTDCGVTGGTVHVPASPYIVTALLAVPSNVRVTGDGYRTVVTQTGASATDVFSLAGSSRAFVENMRLVPKTGASSLRCAVRLDFSIECGVRKLWLDSGLDANGVVMTDSDDCIATRVKYDGGAGLHGYAVYIAGSVRCFGTKCTAYRPQIGFAIVGKDIQSLVTRLSADTIANGFTNCTVKNSSEHAFDVNSAQQSMIVACHAKDYAGVSTHVAFQTKHPSNAQLVWGNTFVGCTVSNYYAGFGGQQAAKSVYIGCTADTVTDGLGMNAMAGCSFQSCIVRNFSGVGIHTTGGSVRNTFIGITLEPSGTTQTGILLGTSGDSGNIFDDVQMYSTMTYAISIVAGANDNRFGRNVRTNAQPISDLSTATQWPVVITTPEVALTGTASVNGPFSLRGMIVVHARLVVTVAITGTPQVQCGYLGSSAAIAAAQVVSGAAGSATDLTLASQLFPTAGTMQGRSQVAGSAGQGFFQYEGLPRL